MARGNDWTSLAWQSWSLAVDASAVIAMRLAGFARLEEDSLVEAQRMISEKIEAAAFIQTKALTGGLGRSPAAGAQKVVSHYRKAVAKNRRRLSRRKRAK